MRAEGAGERDKMLWLSEIASKYSFFLLSCLAMPCVFEMDSLLNLWLGDVPKYSILFCRMVLIASMADTITCGLVLANQAVGNVKQYSLVVNTVKLFTLPFVFLGIILGAPVVFIAVCFILFECFCAFLRIPFVAKTGNLKIGVFVYNVFARLLIPLIVLIISTIVVKYMVEVEYGFVLTFIIPNICYVIAFYYLGIKSEEKQYIKVLYNKINRL